MLTRILWLAPFLLAVEGCAPATGDAEILLTTNESGTFDADFVGEGGDAVEAYIWSSPLTMAQFSMDITAAKGGSAQVEISDATGTLVGTPELVAGVGDDSLDGFTQRGEPGQWIVTVQVQQFRGDGSVSIGSAKADDL